MVKEGSSETWRVFCAIDVRQNVRDALMAHIKELREKLPQARASWSRPDGIHLTLKFLGEVPLTKIERFSSAVELAVKGFDPLILSLGGSGVFPSHGSPRVLWIGVQDPSGKLAKLHARLEDESAKAGFEKETRSFHPHLTLARLRRQDRRVEEPHGKSQHVRILAAAHKELQFPPREITVSELLVIRSELSSAGSKYSVISRHPLKKCDKL